MTNQPTLPRRSVLALAGAMMLLPSARSAVAQTRAPQAAASTWPAITDVARDGPRRFVTDHEGEFNGRKVRYRATVAETILMDADGKPASSVFNASYVVLDQAKASARPVIFIFNGGPGGASNALHFGALGPVRMVDFTPAAQADPKTPLVANPETVLDVADLVFVDPPETGFGRPLPGADPKTFRGIDADSYAVGQFIVHWLVTNGRMDSPKYLAGESYGGHRSVALMRDLPRATPKVDLDGVILISPALGYNGPNPGVISHLPDPLRSAGRIEDAAALGWYWGKIDNRSQTLGEAVEKARAFVQGEYAGAMLLGTRLDDASRRRIAKRLADLTGYSADYFLANGLRIGNQRRDFLASEGLVLDQFDGREAVAAASLPAQDRDRDWDAVMLGLTEDMMKYTTRDLGVSGLDRYRSVVPDPYGFEDTWQYLKPPASGLDVVLAEQLKAQPNLRILAPLGVFDTTGSLNGQDAQFAQMDVAPGQIVVRYCAGGHMVYSSADGRRAFTDDVRAFVTHAPIASREFPKLSPRRAS